MITAHLPSGYVLSSAARWRGPVMGAAIVGAIFPDLDLFVFYFIDDRAVHHHRYWVHAPAFAAACSALLYAIAATARPQLRHMALAFGTAWMMHLALDTIAGDIMWAWPFSTEGYALLTIPGRPNTHFIIAYLTHWSIVFEVMIWGAAIILWLQRRGAE